MKVARSTGAPAEILLLDGDAASRRWMQAALAPLAMPVRAASRPADALLHYRIPALIVVGPGVTSPQRIALLQSLSAHAALNRVPLLFLLAEAVPASLYADGAAVDCMPMPVPPEALRARVGAFLELKNTHAALDAERRERLLAQARLREAEQRLQAMATRLNGIREEERARIAREIHDELGQVLTALRMDVAWMARRFGDLSEALAEKTSSMKVLIDATVHLVQRICSGLRPDLVDQIGLVGAIRRHARDFCKRTGIRCRCILPDKDDRTLPPELAHAAFRTFQELLTNATRHARATHVQVRVEISPAHLLLEVVDDGVGIPAERIDSPRSLGLIGMRERAAMFGGTFTVTGGSGTRGTFAVPRPLPVAESGGAPSDEATLPSSLQDSRVGGSLQ